MIKISFVLILIVLASTAFAQVDRAKVHFADTTTARAAIVDDAAQPYFSLMLPLEMITKTADSFATNDLEEMRQICRERYQNSVLEFTEQDKNAILWILDGLSEQFSTDYPKLAELEWNFIKIKDSIEGGLPHTRGKYIFLSQSLSRIFSMSKEKVDENPAIEEVVLLNMSSIFVHEQLHVFQRAHPGIFDEIYWNKMNFIKPDELPENAWINEHNVFNPDAPNIDWVKWIVTDNDTSYVWPMVLLKDENPIPRMPHDFLIVGVSLKRNGDKFEIVLDDQGIPSFENLLNIAGYYDGIPLLDRTIFDKEIVFNEGMSTAYHPEEALASLFMTIFSIDRIPAEYIFEGNRDMLLTTKDEYKQIFQKYLK